VAVIAPHPLAKAAIVSDAAGLVRNASLDEAWAQPARELKPVRPQVVLRTTVKPDRERVRGLFRPDHPPEEHVLNRGLAMPLYDYQCKDCSELFEVRATIKEKEAGLALACPMCGSQETRQRLTYASVLHGGKSASLPTLSRPACGPNAGSGCCG